MYNKLSLSWDSYQKSICNGLSFLQQRGEFVDMTIAADGHHVKVHQMVMSLVSPYIKELVQSTQCQQPIIFLNRVSYETLQLILEYAYTGEVLVPQDNLHKFLEACSVLHIKGLEDESMRTTSERAILTLSGNEGHSGEAHMDHATSTGEQQPLNFEQHIDSHNKQNDGVVVDCTVDDMHMSDGHTSLDERQGEAREEGDRVEVEPSTERQQVPAPSVQYSLSCQGSIMIILNRYLYRLRYSRKNERKMWRCADYYGKKCPAYVITKGDRVLERGCAHTHPFHDRQILKRVRAGNVFAHFVAAQSLASRYCPQQDQGED